MITKAFHGLLFRSSARREGPPSLTQESAQSHFSKLRSRISSTRILDVSVHVSTDRVLIYGTRLHTLLHWVWMIFSTPA
jgi:hypothetical protein